MSTELKLKRKGGKEGGREGGKEGGTTYLDVTIGELGGQDEGSVGNTDAVVGFISLL
jgi:hypothetical protein